MSFVNGKMTSVFVVRVRVTIMTHITIKGTVNQTTRVTAHQGKLIHYLTPRD